MNTIEKLFVLILVALGSRDSWAVVHAGQAQTFTVVGAHAGINDSGIFSNMTWGDDKNDNDNFDSCTTDISAVNMVNYADQIVMGQVIDTESQWDSQRQTIYTTPQGVLLLITPCGSGM